MLNFELVALAALVLLPASAVGRRAASRSGLSADLGSDLAWWGLAGFLVTARTTWLVANPGALRYPVDVIRLTQGLVTPAGVLGAVAAIWLLHRRRARATPFTNVLPTVVLTGLAASFGWQAGCWTQDRCGGAFTSVPFGVPLGGPRPQVPIAPLAGLVALALGIWVWRSLGAVDRPARRALVAAGLYLAASVLLAAVGLRLTSWPGLTDVATAIEAIALLAFATRLRPAGAEGDAHHDAPPPLPKRRSHGPWATRS